MATDSDQEYAQVCVTLRHYSALRFGTRTLFLVLSVGMAVIALGIIPYQTVFSKTVAKIFGVLMVGFFWASERHSARYIDHLNERAAQLETALGYRLWSGMPRSTIWFARPALIIPLVYAGIAVFWIITLIAVQ